MQYRQWYRETGRHLSQEELQQVNNEIDKIKRLYLLDPSSDSNPSWVSSATPSFSSSLLSASFFLLGFNLVFLLSSSRRR